jgi:SAM-dependent methyltransferase
LPSPSIGVGLNKKFIINIFLDEDTFPEFNIIFKFKGGQLIEKSVDQLCEERISRYASLGVMPKFKKMIGGESKLLDLGGRNRSRLDRSKEFINEVVVFDVLDGENVDVVGDAHELSSYFPKCSFDAVMSICVFEHLLMPWKVVLEINKILRDGGLCCIYTHQTIGLHDSPWDFFRFSEDSWASLFNTKSGFEIIDYGSDFEQFIIPFVWHPGKLDAEKSAGREASWVIVRKISETQLCWPVNPREIIKTNYPEEPDANNPDSRYM